MKSSTFACPQQRGLLLGRVALALACLLPTLVADSGSVDRGFTPVFSSETLPAYPGSICTTGDGDIVVAGSFNGVNGSLAGSIVRLRADGSVVPDFQTPPNSWTYTTTVAALPRGRMLIAGDTLFSATDLGLPDGRIHYRPCASSGACEGVKALTVQNNGAVFATGRGLWWGASSSPVVRFHPHGELDLSYRPPFSSQAPMIGAAVDDQGRLVVITSGLRSGGIVSPDYALVRLTPQGDLDETFRPEIHLGCPNVNHINAPEARIGIQADGRIVVAASWTECDFQRGFRIFRLLPDGVVDPEFSPSAPFERVTALALEAEGSILVAGTEGLPCAGHRIIFRRLLPDGRLDPTFAPQFEQVSSCPKGTITGVATAAGRIWVVGSFDRVNGLPSQGLAVLASDGSSLPQPDVRLNVVAPANAAAGNRHGAVFVSGRTFDSVNGVARPLFAKLLPDGSLAPSFEVTNQTALTLGARSTLFLKPTSGPEVLLVATNNGPVMRLLASGAVDPTFALPANLRTGFSVPWQMQQDSQGRLVCTTYSNQVLRAFRLKADGSWDPSYTPFTWANRGPGYARSNLTALDSAGRLIVAGHMLSNTFGGLLRLKADGGPDPSFGPPALNPGEVMGLAVGADDAPIVLAGEPPRPLWLSSDGRELSGAPSLPPLPARGLGLTELRGFFLDPRQRLYLVLQPTATNFVAYRFTASREWDRGFVVSGRGGQVGATLSPDGDWLYLAGPTEINGVRSGGLLRISTLESPRVEALGASPWLGNVLRLSGEPGRRHRLEVSTDLQVWTPFLDLALGPEPTWLTDWFGWEAPRRFYRLSLITPSTEFGSTPD